jgi:hypothetical protein
MSAHPDGDPNRRIVYLLGAGATHGAVKYAGSQESLVMPGLIDRLLEHMRSVYIEHFHDHPGIRSLVNDVVDAQTDFEHLLTFLADTPSASYQEFAERLKTVFSTVLRAALDRARVEGGDHHARLYAVLVDMHQVESLGESLAGFLTLNYDSFLEHAIQHFHARGVDYGVRIDGIEALGDPIPVLKLHGSFSWRHVWPIALGGDMDPGLWIPPGIRKAKTDYPFNAIWGAARALLDCDVLRIIGCNLGPNDWDLVSLLFTTMHGRESAPPYEIEVVGPPSLAGRIADAFPYLNVRSLFQIPQIGPQLVAEVLGAGPDEFDGLDATQQCIAITNAGSKVTNPFEQWLRLKGEVMVRDLPTISTGLGLFSDFVEEFG